MANKHCRLRRLLIHYRFSLAKQRMLNVGNAFSATQKGFGVAKKVVECEKRSTWKKQVYVSGEDVQEILEQLKNFSELKNKFLGLMPSWKKTREETIFQLYKMADECDSLHKDCNIANVTGSSVGAAGGIIALGGIMLAPFTFGGSIGLSIAGIATGVAGAATNITTSIVESSKMKEKCEVMRDGLNRDKKKTEEICAVVEELMGYVMKLDLLRKKLKKVSNLESISIGLDSTLLVANSVTSAYSIAKNAQAVQLIRSFTAAEISVLKECPKMLKNLKPLKETALVAGKLATFLAVAAVGFSILEIISTSKDIHGGSRTEAGKQFRENARNLQEQMNSLCEVEQRLLGY